MRGDSDSVSFSVSERDGGSLVVVVRGELDLATAPDFARVVAELRVEAGASVVLDVAELAFVDSSGLNAIVAAARVVEGCGGSFVVAGPGSHIERLFEIVHLHDTVAIESSVDAALARAAASAPERGAEPVP